MTDTELVIIDDKTDLNTFEQQLEMIDVLALFIMKPAYAVSMTFLL